jgi:Tfp pilus assembly ATPase PilU
LATPSDDLDALIGELNDRADRFEPSGGDSQFASWVRHVVTHKGSDLLLVTGSPPVMRVDGSLVTIAGERLTGVDVEHAILPLLPAHAAAEYERAHIVDAS